MHFFGQFELLVSEQRVDLLSRLRADLVSFGDELVAVKRSRRGQQQGFDAIVFADYEYEFVASFADEVVRNGGLAVVTRNVAGCTVLSKSGTDDFPAYRFDGAVDDTGAGDVFAAALFVELHRGVPLAGAVRFAATRLFLSLAQTHVEKEL